MEREANQFAAELLMPQPLVTELVARYAPQFQGEDLVWRLATELLVSRAAMRWRLKGLDFLP
jgi:Zn-dependent peptidase ImmA (M78 family)